MKITLSEIARQTGISTATLSRVCTGNGYVSEANRKRAMAALAQYGYVRSDPQPSRRGEMDEAIALITGSVGSAFQAFIGTFSNQARRNNKKLVIFHSDFDPKAEEETLRLAEKNGAYGVVMLNAVQTPDIRQLVRACKGPLVMLGSYIPQLKTDIVTWDSYEIGLNAARLFIEAGHTRLGVIGAQAESSATQDTFLGFEDQMKASGIALNPQWVGYGKPDYQCGVEYGKKLLAMDEAPTAILTCSERMAMGISDTLLRAGCRIPRDLSLICSGILPSHQFHLLRFNHFNINGDTLVRLVMQRLDERHRDPDAISRQTTILPQYVEGETLGPPRNTLSLRP